MYWIKYFSIRLVKEGSHLGIFGMGLYVTWAFTSWIIFCCLKRDNVRKNSSLSSLNYTLKLKLHPNSLFTDGCLFPDEDASNVQIMCAWCQKVGVKRYSLSMGSELKSFCSEKCFAACRRAYFKRNKVKLLPYYQLDTLIWHLCRYSMPHISSQLHVIKKQIYRSW